MQLIAADIGNSSTKIAVDVPDHENRWESATVIRGNDPIKLDTELDGENPAFWSVSSVNKKREQQLADWIANHRPDDQFHIIAIDDIGLETNVENPQQLGRDRLVAAWQAIQLNESGPLIVIDAGTAVTIDLVDEKNVFQGGLIFPGAHTNLRCLSTVTDALPDLAEAELKSFLTNNNIDLSQNGFIGKSTESAIILGVYQTQISSLTVAINELSRQYGALDVYMTGGGIDAIVRWLPDHWQHVPDLVLQGATEIGREIMKKTIRR